MLLLSLLILPLLAVRASREPAGGRKCKVLLVDATRAVPGLHTSLRCFLQVSCRIALQLPRVWMGPLPLFCAQFPPASQKGISRPFLGIRACMWSF